MMPFDVRTKITAIVDAISTGQFALALDAADSSRLSEDDLRHPRQARYLDAGRVVTGYGRTLVPPVTHDWDVVPIAASATPAWSVRAPLWSEQEGRSDLELVLSASLVEGTANVVLDDLLVA